LDGSGDPTDITDDEWSRYLLTSMRRHSKEIKIEITKEKMMNKYKIWKERTSTSPSGRHLGHFHGLFEMELGYFERALYLASRKILSKLLRIEMENYHIIMTMGMYRIKPPWILI
jgi:hypothetical protein